METPTLQQLHSIQIKNLMPLQHPPSLMDSFLTLQVPPSTILQTDTQLAETNPTFQLNQPIHPSKHLFPSNIVKISLHARPSQPNNHGLFHLLMIWLVDFTQLIYLCKSESEMNFQLANDTHLMSTCTTSSNELYLFFETGVYLFKPISQQEEQEEAKDHDEKGKESEDLRHPASTESDPPDDPSQHLNDRNDPTLTNQPPPKLLSLGDLVRYMEKTLELEQTLEETRHLEQSWKLRMKLDCKDEGEEEQDEGQDKQISMTARRFNLIRKISQLQQNLTSLNSLQTSSDIHLLKLRDRLREQKAEVTRKRKLHEAAQRRLENLLQINLTRPRNQLRIQEKPKLEKIQARLNSRRSDLMGELSKIYPIEPISSNLHSNSSSNDNTPPSSCSLLLFSIAGVILPNLEPTTTNVRANQSRLINSSSHKSSSLIHLLNYHNHNSYERKLNDLAEDDSIVSTALGFISHLITLVSSYLNVPLVYPICFFGSRSSVSDFVSRINGPRSFPLYFKGVDRFRFEYAVFLLNKNIEQIMYHQKIIVSELRQTLPNLKNLFLTLEPNPTQSESRSSMKGCSMDLRHQVESSNNLQKLDNSFQLSTDLQPSTALKMADSKRLINHNGDVKSKNGPDNDEEPDKSTLDRRDFVPPLSPDRTRSSFNQENQLHSRSSNSPSPPPPTTTTLNSVISTSQQLPSNQNSLPSLLPLTSSESSISCDESLDSINSFTFNHHSHSHSHSHSHHHQFEKSI